MPQDEPRSSAQPKYPYPAKRENPWNRKGFAGKSSTPVLSEIRRQHWSGSVGLRRCLVIVGIVALVTNGLSLASSQLWVYPDSIDYIVLAGGIADHFDFQNELFLLRTPGYPIFLASIFKVFGSSSPMVILVIQHFMAVATALIASLIAWNLSQKLSITLLTGLFCGLSLQLLSYANLILTETPFTLAVTLCVYYLIRYHREGITRHLVFASLCVGVGYLLKPIALYLLGVCGLVVLFRIFQSFKINKHDPWLARFVKKIFSGWALAVLPALAVASPWIVNNAITHQSLQVTRSLDYVYYIRAAKFDGLDSTHCPTVVEIHEVIAEAIRRGDLPPDADYKERQTVIDAYHSVHNTSFSESTVILGRAGRELMFEYPGTIFINTFKYAAWLLLTPDPVYRFVPGGTPGIGGQRAKEAGIYDIGTYSVGQGSWDHVLKQYDHYLPLTTQATPLTPFALRVTRWFSDKIEHGGKIGFLDSPYEVVIAICLLGFLFTLYSRENERERWFVLIVVVSLHVMISAFFGASQTRYALPIKPLLLIFLAYMVVMMANVVYRTVFKIEWLRKFRSSHPANQSKSAYPFQPGNKLTH